MKHSWFYIFSTVVFLLFLTEDITAQEVSEKANFISGIDVTLDALKPLSYVVDFEDKYEVGAGVFFYNKLMFSGEYGFASLTPKKAIENGYYKSEGNYFRLGLDYYKALNPKDNLYFGARYGSAKFIDEYQYYIPSTIWNEYQSPLVYRPDQKANWFELILGSERAYKKYFILGFRARIRILSHFNQFDDIKVFSIPGYGYAERPVMPTANIYIKFRLPF